MPVNGEHYFGIRFGAVQETIDRLEADPELLARVARQGHQWAMQHYSPQPLAERLLTWNS